MTYNQVIKRIKQISLAHLQVRNFYKGLVTDFLSDRTTLYASAFLQTNSSGSISATNGSVSFGFSLYLLDLVHLSEDTKDNEQDVQSDMLSVGVDLVAQLSSYLYTDWRMSQDNQVQFTYENEGDFIAGVIIDFTIRIPYMADKCQIPTNGMPIAIDQDTKYVEDMVYIATGDEGNIIVVSALTGKKILLITRESAVIYEVSNLPNSTEFTWDGTTINLGLETQPQERYLILYRNY